MTILEFEISYYCKWAVAGFLARESDKIEVETRCLADVGTGSDDGEGEGRVGWVCKWAGKICF